MAKRYSVYNRRTDMPIVIYGTAKECAKALGIDLRSFQKQASRCRHGRPVQKYEIFEDEEDDDNEMDLY